jgi:hypothetical protein
MKTYATHAVHRHSSYHKALNCVGDKKTLPRELSGFSLSAMKKKEKFEAFSRLEVL